MTVSLDRRVLLVGWDAADWQVIHPLLDGGLMPNMERLIEGGVMGNVASLSPMLSPILWTSIATGKRAYVHGASGFVEPLADRSGVRPVGTDTRRCAAQAFEISLRMRPGFIFAHRYLSRIYARIGRSDLASRHRDEAARLLEMRAPQPMAD